jgi:hypothetical protein
MIPLVKFSFSQSKSSHENNLGLFLCITLNVSTVMVFNFLIFKEGSFYFSSKFSCGLL